MSESRIRIPEGWGGVIQGGLDSQESHPELTLLDNCIPMVPNDRHINTHDIPLERGNLIILFPEFDSPPPPIAS